MEVKQEMQEEDSKAILAHLSNLPAQRVLSSILNIRETQTEEEREY